ncbi:alpha/beta fold hydrolase [Pseudomonas sp. SLFW]|uniref:alpha/beta fold hydrolase n=1 Tax=Pseudomonas sp. SLFW TaxID=2683259 RepID=UPI0014122DFC|nr:alpha/beta hydrolase [Pseudomonas sp. SLFW]NBB08427.1 alpha/beta fold hydrolase [Pseudomonas sp. SLFW]
MNALDLLLLTSLRTINRWRFALKLRRHGRLSYLESRRQEGATLVLLHGLGASKDQWGPEVCKLARKHHCLFIDLPGHGQSSCLARQGLGPQAMLVELEPLLDRLSTRPIVLIGSSLGGCVAGLYAAKKPGRVQRLILLAPSGLGDAALGPVFQAGLLTGRDGNFGYRTVEEMQRFWSLLFVHPPQVAGRVARALAASGRARYATVQKVVADTRREGLNVLVAQLPSITCRTLVIWGSDDQVFSIAALGPLLKALPDACSQVIEGTGHVPYLERGDEVVGVITKFVRV